MTEAEGYAIVQDKVLDIRTVSAMRRGAMVNWLAVKVGLITLVGATDEQIEEMFDQRAPQEGVEIHKVEIKCVP